MLFNTVEFLIFFIIVYSLYLISNHKWQNYILLVASCLFYMAFIPVYILILFFLILIDYFAGIWIEDNLGDKKKLFLTISVISTCLVLFVFKYFNFFNGNFALMAKFLGWNYPVGILKIILPIGLSFHTFQSLSYVVEVYRGKQKAERHFTTYALYVMFFPQLVAGPIERASNLLPQIVNPRKLSPDKIYEGIYLIFWGLFQKVFVADNLALLVDPIFASNHPYNGAMVVLGLYSFAFQIYCDFAGYSNMARGLAKCLGFELMVNFNLPYFAVNPSDFWKRWHISLSSWLKDYLYVPLGGNKNGSFATYKNLFLTMLLGGLWHGAAWTFVLWGMYQGLLLIFYRLISSIFKLTVSFNNYFAEKLWFLLRVAVFFQFVCIGWLFFRAQSAAQVYDMFTSIFCNFHIIRNIGLWQTFSSLLFYTSVLLILESIQFWKNDLMIIFKSNFTVKAIFYYVLFYLILIFGVTHGREFIYFQF